MNNKNLNDYEPKKILAYFSELCKIPHVSGNEEQLAKYLVNFFTKNNINVRMNSTNSIYLSKPATNGFENKPTILLQSHFDMVAAKKHDMNFDFSKDSIKPYVEDGWIKAEGTTLGADNGIGVAMIMDIFTNSNIKHGPLEALLTTDEETDMKGCKSCKDFAINAKYILNIDGEAPNVGDVFIGSSGSLSTIAKLDFKRASIKKDWGTYKIEISNLLGGHSGSNIVEKRLNAIKVISDTLLYISQKYPIQLINITGGTVKNAIASQCSAIVAFDQKQLKEIFQIIEKRFKELKDNYASKEKSFIFDIKKYDTDLKAIDDESTKNIIMALVTSYQGVISYNEKYKIPDLSNNIGVVKTNDESFEIEILSRALYKNLLKEKVQLTKTILESFNFKCNLEWVAASWMPKTKDGEQPTVLQEKVCSFIKELFNEKTDLHVTSTGLELGYFNDMWPDVEGIVLSVDIVDAHSINEKVRIGSIQKTYKLIINLLEKINW